MTDSLSAAEEINTDTTAGEGATGGVWHEVLDTNTNCIYYWNQQDNITSWVIPTNATVVKLQSSTAADTGKNIVTVNKLCNVYVWLYMLYVSLYVCFSRPNGFHSSTSNSN